MNLINLKVLLSLLFLLHWYNILKAQNCVDHQVYATIDPFTSYYEKYITLDNQFSGFLNIHGEKGFVEVLILYETGFQTTDVYRGTYGKSDGSFTMAPIPINLVPDRPGFSTFIVRYTFTEGIDRFGGAEVNLSGQDCKIYGNTSVTTGNIERFIFNNGNTVAQPHWSADGGTIINVENPSAPFTNYEVDVNFYVTGEKYIRFWDGENNLAAKSVTVSLPPENLRIQGPETVMQGEEVIYSFDNGVNFTPNWMDGSYKSIKEWNEGTTYYIKLKWLYDDRQLLTLITTPPEIFLDERMINVLPAHILGCESPNSGSIQRYTYDNGSSINQPNWQVPGGEVINTIVPTGESTRYEIDINWIETGSQEIVILDGSRILRREEVVVAKIAEHLRIQGPLDLRVKEIGTFQYTNDQISPNWQTDGTILKEWSDSEVHYVNVLFDVTGLNYLDIRDESRDNLFLNRIEVNVASQPLNNRNHIKITDIQAKGVSDISQVEKLSLLNKNVSYEYYDGLGRPIQNIYSFNSPKGYDIIVPIVYDQYGQQSKQYLPVTVNESNGLFKENILDANGNYTGIAATFYSSSANNKVADDLRPYSETIFETSPLSRPLENHGPGQDWHDNGKYIEYSYLVNEDGLEAGKERIIAWTINDSGLPIRYKDASFNNGSGYHPSVSLMIESTKDEEGMSIREYTNKQGQVILKKIQQEKHSPLDLNNRDYWIQTYYIYDALGNLRFELTPELVNKLAVDANTNPSTTDLQNFAFQYK